MPSIREKKTHEDHLKSVCAFCKKKTQNRHRLLTEAQKDLIVKERFKEFRRFEKIFLSARGIARALLHFTKVAAALLLCCLYFNIFENSCPNPEFFPHI